MARGAQHVRRVALCGAVPLVPFLLGLGRAFQVAAVLTGLVFFAIGALKSRW